MLQKFDERNRNLIVNVNGELLHRDKAGISPFDSSVQGGDAVWEGLRLYNGRIFKLHGSTSCAPVAGCDLRAIWTVASSQVIGW